MANDIPADVWIAVAPALAVLCWHLGQVVVRLLTRQMLPVNGIKEEFKRMEEAIYSRLTGFSKDQVAIIVNTIQRQTEILLKQSSIIEQNAALLSRLGEAIIKLEDRTAASKYHEVD